MKTLDEVIQEQLAQGKKLGEIRVKNIHWGTEYLFIPYFKESNGVWHGLDADGDHDEVNYNDAHTEEHWHVYTEPKVKKKYWLWNLKDSTDSWYKSSTYMDEEGRSTKGIQNRNMSTERQKLEKEFIEIEVEDE